MSDKSIVRILKMPKWITLIGCFGLLILTVIYIALIIVNVKSGEIENAFQAFCTFLLFAPFWLVCVVFAVNFNLWKVEMYDEYFVYRNWFGIKKTIFMKI